MNKSSFILTNSLMEVSLYQFKYKFLLSEVPLPRRENIDSLEDSNQ